MYEFAVLAKTCLSQTWGLNQFKPV